MKKSIFVFTTITIMFAFVALSCDRSSDKVERAQTSVIEAEKDLSIAKTEIEADARIYRNEMANEIKKNNTAISNIKQKIQNETSETRAAHEVRIAELERTNNDLKRQIDNYRVTNRDNWNTFKNDFSDSMDNLGNSLDNFFTRTATSRN
jgi:septal ring factor EnvC (AmiA/AmiB activator)